MQLDIGVTAEEVEDLLRESPVISVVGFQGSGKSTLAESLAEELRSSGRTVLMQTARSWAGPQAYAGEGGSAASVDPEIVHAMELLEPAHGAGCWIVDDAEVMLAYATERVLENLGSRLRSRRFSLILIRNRFVLEGEGWFQQRQSLIAPNIPVLPMRPMSDSFALKVANVMFMDERTGRAEWLASMSGGVPGLMQDLYKYTPMDERLEHPTPLLMFAARKYHELELERPVRGLLIQALTARVLPPPPFLSTQARSELGVLMLAGMVSPQYGSSGSPFHGEFWQLVARPLDTGQSAAPEEVPGDLQDTALNLEGMLAKADFLAILKQECGVEGAGDGVLAEALAAGMYCEMRYPSLVRPLKPFFTEVMGRFGLMQVLRAHGLSPARSASCADLTELLFSTARGPHNADA